MCDRRVADAHALGAKARELGLDRYTVRRLHRAYLAALTEAAADGEHPELHAVAALLGLPPEEAADAPGEARATRKGVRVGGASARDGARDGARDEARDGARRRARPSLAPGDRVVFTSDSPGDRAVWELRARAAGLRPYRAVTRNVRLPVAVDPDSMSGHARRARRYAIPIVTPDAFADMIGAAV